ncbi:MAG: metallophosphoesterase [Pseudomonadota bacterium]
MRVLILSDLHHDFWAESGRDPFKGIEELLSSLDHILLAGDLTNKPKVRWKQAFQDLARHVALDRVSVFPGNHDFYDFSIDREDRLAEIAASFGVRYVQKKQVHLGKARLLCATLWTDMALGAPGLDRIVARMNDFRKIRVASRGYGRLRPADVTARHRDHVNWLDETLDERFDGKTFVVTHHAPHPDVLQDYSDGLDAAYASDLSKLINKHHPDGWFFGHSHDANNLTLGRTALQNVSLGYPDEVCDPARRIEACIFDL